MTKKNSAPDFMPEVEKLQEQISSLQKRIDLVIQNKEKVRPKIFEKVKADYEVKLSSLFDELNPFKQMIETEIEALNETVSVLSDEIIALEEELEEHELRFIAGEFEDDEYQPKKEELESLINDKKNSIETHSESISKYNAQLAFITGEPVAEEIAEEDQAMDEDDFEEMDEDIEQVDDYEAEEIEKVEEGDEIQEDYEDIPESETDEEDFVQDVDVVQDLGDTSAGSDEFVQEPIEQDMEQVGDDYLWTCTPILDVIEGDFAGESYPMDKDRITVGRGPNNDIQLATDTSVSRHHSQLTREDNRYVLVDLESSNGTSVNGTRITRTYLRPNDELMIGQSKLIIRPSKD
jgi:FHA domain